MPSSLFGAKTAARPHLVKPGGGLSGEVYDLRRDVDEAFTDLESNGGYLFTEEFTNPALADTDAIVASIASSASITTLTGAALDGAVGATEMSPPRIATITTSIHADIDAVAVVLTGTILLKDGSYGAQTDTITLTDGGAALDAGTKAFSTITSAVIPAQAGAGGTVTIGFGATLGMARAMKSRGGLLAPVREIAVGAVVATGTFVDAATSAPYGTYTPAAAPDGANDYVLTYEVDPTV